MTTEYRVSLDRAACEGVFACLVRDERFVEASDGLATVEGANDGNASGEIVATFDDNQIEDARQAAEACPVDAITVTEGDDE